MDRRNFLDKIAIGSIGVAAIAAPAAHAQSSVRWRMTTSWPKSLDNIYGSAEQMCKRIGELTDGRFEIRCFPAGEIVPPAQAMDAVSNGTVECNHVLSSAYIGKNSALAFDAGMAFGLNARQHCAWLYHGGGMQALRKLYGKYNIINFTTGNVGVQMGGFYRKEIKSLADVKGLKMRIGGIGGLVLEKMGAQPQQIPPGDTYSALEKGAIDAAEWIGPYDDLKLGFNKVAPFYYAPGWWEGSASVTSMVNQASWDSLSPEFKAAFEVAANEQSIMMMARYDATNPAALRQLISGGAKVSYFPRDVMDAAYGASQELWKELSDKNPDFAEIYPAWANFQKEQVSWFRVAETALDGYTFNAVQRDK